jgi:hypothetical protein
MKGIVERMFRSINDDVLSHLPGHVRKTERGDRYDPKVPANLSLRDLNRVLCRYVVYLNIGKRMKDYPLTEDMVKDGVEPYPAELWDWGINNITGQLRHVEPIDVYLGLLPRSHATVSREGILYKGLAYSAETIPTSWYSGAKIDGTWKVTIAFDPRSVEFIYLCLDREKPVKCNLLKKTGQLKYEGLDWYELANYKNKNEGDSRKSFSLDLGERSVFYDFLDEIKSEVAAREIDISKADKIRDIRGKRRDEIKRIRSELFEGIDEGSNVVTSSSEQTVSKTKEPGWYIGIDTNISAIRNSLKNSDIKNDQLEKDNE